MSPSSSPLLPARALRLAHGSTGHAQKRPRGQVYFAGACTRRPAGGRAAAAGAPAPGVGVGESFPRYPPSLRAAAGAGAEAGSVDQPVPGPAEPCPESGAPRGAAPGEESR